MHDAKLRKIDVPARGIRFSLEVGGKEVARAFLYILRNDLHNEPFGFIEDVHVVESHRGRRLASRLIAEVIAEARRNSCYKIVETSRFSRPEVHRLYKRLDFKRWGYEFRLNLT